MRTSDGPVVWEINDELDKVFVDSGMWTFRLSNMVDTHALSETISRRIVKTITTFLMTLPVEDEDDKERVDDFLIMLGELFGGEDAHATGTGT